MDEFLCLKDFKIVLELIQTWPCNIYDLKYITNEIKKKYEQNSDTLLLESLVILYQYQKMFDKSFLVYISLKDTSVFEYLIKHQLYVLKFNLLFIQSATLYYLKYKDMIAHLII